MTMMPGDTDLEEEEMEHAPNVPELVVKQKRLSPSAKWDAMDIQGRLDVLHDMEQREMLPRGVLVRDYYAEWDALDMRFGNLLYDVQEKVVSYMRKNYADLD